MSERAGFVVATVTIALCLVAGSLPRIVGDGGEYLVQAFNFASFDGPSLGRQEMPRLEARLAAVEPDLADWRIEYATMAGSDLRRDFLHFWFYALLAAPLVAAADSVAISPLHGFTALNVALIAIALGIAGPRIGVAASLLLFASPLMWWIDKAHTEIFTVALLTIAFVAMRDREWLAPVAAGAAATQNPPIAAVVVLMIAAAALRSRGAVARDRLYLTGAVLGVALAALQPLYTLARHGTPSLLLRATKPGLPTASELGATVLDPSMGLVGNFPLLVVGTLAVVVLALVRDRRALLTPDVVVAIVAAPIFLYAFAQTSNPHHGATPSLTRYALWFIPLAVPIWRLAAERRLVRPALAWSTAVVSAVVSLFAFHPAVEQHSREPTWLASWLWHHHPSWNDPLPEVFSETLLRTEGTYAPVATPGCSKILLFADPGGSWPLACLPAPIAPDCRVPGALCYANREGDRYTFSPTPGRPTTAALVSDAAWPVAAEPHVRRILLGFGWPELADRGLVDLDELRERHDVRVAAFGDESRILLILQATGPAPRLRLRSARPLKGTLYAARTGQEAGEVHLVADAQALQEIALPTGIDLFILTMTAESLDP